MSNATTAKPNKVEAEDSTNASQSKQTAQKSVNGTYGANRFNNDANGAHKNHWQNNDRSNSRSGESYTPVARYCDICKKRGTHDTDHCRYKKSTSRVEIVGVNSTEDECECDLRDSKRDSMIVHNVGCNSKMVFRDADYDEVNINNLMALVSEHETSHRNYTSMINSVSVYDEGEKSNFYRVPKHPVRIKIGDRVLDAIVDSGTEISVFAKSNIHQLLANNINTQHVRLRAAFGETVDAPIMQIPCAAVHNDNTISGPYVIDAAIVDHVQRTLLTPADYDAIANGSLMDGFVPQVAAVTGTKFLATEELKQPLSSGCDTNSSVAELFIIDHVKDRPRTDNITTNCSNQVDICEGKDDDEELNLNILYDIVGVCKSDVNVVTRSGKHLHKNGAMKDKSTSAVTTPKLDSDDAAVLAHSELLQAQKQDRTLAAYWSMAEAGKSEFFLRDKLLYRSTCYTALKSTNLSYLFVNVMKFCF